MATFPQTLSELHTIAKKFQAAHAVDSVEHGLIVCRDGTEIKLNGTETAVKVDGMVDPQKVFGAAHFHNHPMDLCLSIPDFLIMFKYGFVSMTATTPAHIYMAVLTDNVAPGGFITAMKKKWTDNDKWYAKMIDSKSHIKKRLTGNPKLTHDERWEIQKQTDAKWVRFLKRECPKHGIRFLAFDA